MTYLSNKNNSPVQAMSSSLAQLQQTFQSHVLNPEENASVQWISAKGRAAPEIQLSIYSHAYQARLIEVLSNDYPAVLRALGEEQFETLAKSYIKAHPSHYFSLSDFGKNLSPFIYQLTQLTDTVWHEMPWLTELALFEFTLGEAFNAADACIFTDHDMANVPAEVWAELNFILHPSVKRLSFNYNIVEIWQTLTDDTPQAIEAKKEEPNQWLIWREQLITQFRSMEVDEQLAFNTLYNRGDFTDICESLVTLINEEDIPLHAASFLKTWINQGLISSAS